MLTPATSPTASNPLSWLSALFGLLAVSAAATCTLLAFLAFQFQYSRLPEPWNTLLIITEFLSYLGVVALVLGILALNRNSAPQTGKKLAILGIVTGAVALFLMLALTAFFIILMVTGHASV